MIKSFFSGMLLCLMFITKTYSQQVSPVTSSYIFHPASEDKPSWQRLNLKLGTSYYRAIKVSRVGSDSSVIYMHKILGISRLYIAGDGIIEPELFAESAWFDKRDPGKGKLLLADKKGKKRLQQLALLGAYYVYQPGNYKFYRDSVEYFLNAAVKESLAANESALAASALCLMGKMYGQAGDTANANPVFNQALDIGRKTGNKRITARAFHFRGEYTQYKPYNLQGKVDDYEKAVKLYHELAEPELEIEALSNLAFLYLVQQRMDDCYNTFMKSFNMQKAIGYPYTYYTSDHIAMLGMLQGKFGDPLKHTLESIKSAELTRDSVGLHQYYLRLGQLYYMEGERTEESLKWMKKALNRVIELNDGEIYSTLLEISSVMIESERKSETINFIMDVARKSPPTNIREQMYYHLALSQGYLGQKQYNLAERNLIVADSLQKVSPDLGVAGEYQQSNIRFMMNNISFEKGEYGKAKKYFEGFLADSTRMPVLSDDIFAYQKLIFIDSVFKDDAAAVKHYKQYLQLVDSNFRVSKLRQAEELQVIYQTQEKEDQIKLLNQQAKLEHANLQQATFVKNTTIAGIIAAMIFLASLYRQNRQKQKSNVLITNKNEQLQHLLTEKDWLVKEIHHRVKNNLQTIMGLLGTQSGYLKNDIAKEAITDSQRRIQAMSLIHQRLYQSNKLSTIKMTDYIHELVDSLNDSFNTNNQIRFDMQIEPVEIDLAHAIPLGLILNESITNSFKYAFQPDQKGIINISFQNLHENNFALKISDNGIGLPEGFDSQKSNSMGMNLMRGLSEEIGAQFRIDGHDGVSVEVSFVYIPDIAVGTKKIALKTSYTL